MLRVLNLPKLTSEFCSCCSHQSVEFSGLSSHLFSDLYEEPASWRLQLGLVKCACSFAMKVSAWKTFAGCFVECYSTWTFLSSSIQQRCCITHNGSNWTRTAPHKDKLKNSYIFHHKLGLVWLAWLFWLESLIRMFDFHKVTWRKFDYKSRSLKIFCMIIMFAQIW